MSLKIQKLSYFILRILSWNKNENICLILTLYFDLYDLRTNLLWICYEFFWPYPVKVWSFVQTTPVYLEGRGAVFALLLGHCVDRHFQRLLPIGSQSSLVNVAHPNITFWTRKGGHILRIIYNYYRYDCIEITKLQISYFWLNL